MQSVYDITSRMSKCWRELDDCCTFAQIKWGREHTATNQIIHIREIYSLEFR